MSGGERRRRPTQVDIARDAQVSQTTVSQVLSNNTAITVPAETRQRVLDVARRLGYVPDRAARSLRTGKTQSIAAIIPDITNPFYPAFVRGIQDIADQHDYDVVTFNSDGQAAKEQRCLRVLLEGRADGVIAVLFHTSAHDLLRLLDRDIAVIRLEARYKPPGPRPLDSLYIDNSAAAASAARYLVERGHRQIGIITSTVGPGPMRLQGYTEVLGAHGCSIDETLVQFGDFTFESGSACAARLLAHRPQPTAILAANDLMALGALAAIRAHGLRVPEDIALVGFDDIQSAGVVTPALTTVGVAQFQLGRRIAEMLFERLDSRATGGGRCEAFPTQLVIRASA